MADGTKDGTTGLRRFVPVTLFVPLSGATLGIDGGPIFQILAIENLGLGPTALGIAFGLGVVSLPVQLWAARIPLHRARRNTQLFLLIAAVQAWILALLVAADVTGPLATTALAITVTAEVSLSVLFATAWQPLLSWSINTRQRQRLNATWAAVARGSLAGLVVLLAALDGPGRAAFIAIVGLAAALCALGLQAVPAPPPPDLPSFDPSDLPDTSTADSGSTRTTPLSRNTRLILVVLGAVNIGALPLWLVYVDRVLWPTANLGLVAGVQTASLTVALLAWRPTDGDVTNRALAASIVILGAVIVIPFVPEPVTTTGAEWVVLAITATFGAGHTLVRVAMLESAHRVVTAANSVRAFTILDVVASTSLQVGLFVSGFLITASTSSTWAVDPYLTFVIAGSVAAVAALVVTQRSVRTRTTGTSIG